MTKRSWNNFLAIGRSGEMQLKNFFKSRPRLVKHFLHANRATSESRLRKISRRNQFFAGKTLWISPRRLICCSDLWFRGTLYSGWEISLHEVNFAPSNLATAEWKPYSWRPSRTLISGFIIETLNRMNKPTVSCFIHLFRSYGDTKARQIDVIIFLLVWSIATKREKLERRARTSCCNSSCPQHTILPATLITNDLARCTIN